MANVVQLAAHLSYFVLNGYPYVFFEEILMYDSGALKQHPRREVAVEHVLVIWCDKNCQTVDGVCLSVQQLWAKKLSEVPFNQPGNAS